MELHIFANRDAAVIVDAAPRTSPTPLTIYHVEASELGLRPGIWPQALVTVITGGDHDWQPITLEQVAVNGTDDDLISVEYRNGYTVLVVLND